MSNCVQITGFAGEINRLHNELSGLARTSLEKAIRIGELLSQQKATLKHGDWLPWCRENLEFSYETACRYVRLHRERKSVIVTDLKLTEAYKALSTGKLGNANHGGDKDEYRSPEPVDGVLSDFSAIEDLGVKFGTIYADPPWRYNNQGTRAATNNHYDGTLSVDELCQIPVGDVSADKAHLHLWVTNAFLFEVPRIFDAWGFTYKSTFVWVKPQMGIGNYWRNSHEIMVLGVRGGLTAQSRDQMSWLECRRGAHSSKPQQVREAVEKLSPGPRLELFGRRSVKDWVVFGNQVERVLV